MSTRRASKKYLAELEKQIKGRGVKVAYERLQYAGLVLRGGMCWFKGDYYLFIDRRKTVAERCDQLENALDELSMLATQGKLDDPRPDETKEDAGESA